MWHGLFPPKQQQSTIRVTDLDGHEVHSTGTFKAVRRPDSQQSFGHEFNLIKAVAEYGPQRVAEINKRLIAIEQETSRLMEERTTLEALIKVVKPVP